MKTATLLLIGFLAGVASLATLQHFGLQVDVTWHGDRPTAAQSLLDAPIDWDEGQEGEEGKKGDQPLVGAADVETADWPPRNIRKALDYLYRRIEDGDAGGGGGVSSWNDLLDIPAPLADGIDNVDDAVANPGDVTAAMGAAYPNLDTDSTDDLTEESDPTWTADSNQYQKAADDAITAAGDVTAAMNAAFPDLDTDSTDDLTEETDPVWTAKSNLYAKTADLPPDTALDNRAATAAVDMGGQQVNSVGALTFAGTHKLDDVGNDLEVVLPAGGSLEMNDKPITEVGAPTADDDAATKLYVDTELDAYVPPAETDPVWGGVSSQYTKAAALLSGGDTTVNEGSDLVSWFKLKDIPAPFADGTDDGAGGSSPIDERAAVNDVNMGANSITNMAAPVADTDAATKLYVDTEIGAVTETDPVWGGVSSQYQKVADDAVSDDTDVISAVNAEWPDLDTDSTDDITEETDPVWTADSNLYLKVSDEAAETDPVWGGVSGQYAKVAAVVAKAGSTMTGDLTVPADVYAADWNGDLTVPTKDALYDKIATLGTGGGGNPVDSRDATNDVDLAGFQLLGADEVGFFAGPAIGASTTTFTFDSKRLAQVADPVNDQEAATKKYVDDEIDAYTYTETDPVWVAERGGYLQLTGGTLTGDLTVPDEVYGAGWNGDLTVPTKDALYDKIETLGGGGGGGGNPIDSRAATNDVDMANNNVDNVDDVTFDAGPSISATADTFNFSGVRLVNLLAPTANNNAATKQYVDDNVFDWSTVPGTAAAAGTAGDLAYDGSYLYICTAANTWRRTTLAAW